MSNTSFIVALHVQPLRKDRRSHLPTSQSGRGRDDGAIRLLARSGAPEPAVQNFLPRRCRHRAYSFVLETNGTLAHALRHPLLPRRRRRRLLDQGAGRRRHGRSSPWCRRSSPGRAGSVRWRGCCRRRPPPRCARTIRRWCSTVPCRDQGAAARLLPRSTATISTRRSRSPAISARANPGGAYEIRPVGMFVPGKAGRHDRPTPPGSTPR